MCLNLYDRATRWWASVVVVVVVVAIVKNCVLCGNRKCGAHRFCDLSLNCVVSIVYVVVAGKMIVACVRMKTIHDVIANKEIYTCY
jgi:hypothetical protein